MTENVIDVWSNIEYDQYDPEIAKICDFEKDLGRLPDHIIRVRELITRFEVCHFKVRNHLENIKRSIEKLQACIDLPQIGLSHIHNGETAWEKDKTGRSILGQQYVWAIRRWLNDNPNENVPDGFNRDLSRRMDEWLGEKSAEKQRLMRLLLARLTWDWTSYRELQTGGEYRELELQVCSMDTCHYAFPGNLDLVLQGLGLMRPAIHSEGCGSYNSEIIEFIDTELLNLRDVLKIYIVAGNHDKKNRIRAWLMACLMKTTKEQIKSTVTIDELNELR